jgi:hypothetical protein
MLPLLEAEATRARARLAAHRGEPESADRGFRRAIKMFGELQTPFYLARAQLEYAELLSATSRDAARVEALRGEAAAVFEAVGARPWLERAATLRPAVAA